MYVDWSERGDYIFRRYQVRVDDANEALNDEDSVWLDPDPKSVSGRSIRVIGFSGGSRQLLTIILLRQEVSMRYWGVNVWVSNARDQKMYREAQP
jgi:hypothetical protein